MSDEENPPEPPLMTTAAVATALGVSVSTVERWRRDGAGPPFVKLGKRGVRYKPAAVAAFVALYTVPGGTRERRIPVDPRQLGLFASRGRPS